MQGWHTAQRTRERLRGTRGHAAAPRPRCGDFHSPSYKLDPNTKRDSRPLQTRPSHRRCHGRRHGQSGPDLTSPITTTSLTSAASTPAPDSLHLEHSYGSRRLHNDLQRELLLQGQDAVIGSRIRQSRHCRLCVEVAAASASCPCKRSRPCKSLCRRRFPYECSR